MMVQECIEAEIKACQKLDRAWVTSSNYPNFAVANLVSTLFPL
jgi:hypothetical protein